jgi:hypothetical protein
VALVKGRADYRVCPGAEAGQAFVDEGAGIVVVAAGVFGKARVGADASCRVAFPGDVALVKGRADYWAGPGAEAGQAFIDEGAGIVVVAVGIFGKARVGADASCRVAFPGDVALVKGRAYDRVCPCAEAGQAFVDEGAGIVVVAVGVFGKARVGADASCRVAFSGDVALVKGRADDRAGPCAEAGHAFVDEGAGIVVVAAGVFGKARVGADTRGRVAFPGDVALVKGRAD